MHVIEPNKQDFESLTFILFYQDDLVLTPTLKIHLANTENTP